MKTGLYFFIPLTLTVFFLIRAEFKSAWKLVYFLKPLSTMLIILTAIAALSLDSINMTYYYGIIIGLMFSLIGDIMLMIQENPKAFKIGLVSFLIGHIAYSVTFVILSGAFYNHFITPIVIIICAIGFFIFLKPGLGDMMIPVVFYLIVISFMVSASTGTFNSDIFSNIQTKLIFCGALFFYVSDLLLAINKFHTPFKLNRLSLIPYFFGQFLLAISVWYF